MCLKNELEDGLVNGDTNLDDTENDVIEFLNDQDCRKKVYVIHTTLAGCPPCKNLREAFEEIREDYEEVIISRCKVEDNPELKDFLMKRGLFGHPSILLITRDYIFWRMGAASVEEEKKFYSNVFDAILEGGIELEEEKNRVVIFTDELGEVSFEGQVIE